LSPKKDEERGKRGIRKKKGKGKSNDELIQHYSEIKKTENPPFI
jgi:hypothetical protein